MKVGIDATVLTQKGHPRGIARYVVSLVEGLAAVDDDVEYYLCYRPRALKRPRKIWRPRDPRFHVRILQEPFNQRLFRQLDVFHSTYQRLPGYRDLAPYLCTVHDIFHMSRPELYSPEKRARGEARYRDVARRSGLIVTVSEFTKNEIIRHLGVDPERVRVIPEAASSNYAPVDAGGVSDVRRRYALERPYILFAGGSDPRKNLLGALQAFALALPRLNEQVCFAVSGAGGPMQSAALEFVRSAGLTDRVRFLDFVPEGDFPGLMTGCLVFFFPTLFEGFGLPALEAMACGAVVVTSSTSSMPEVCGDAALMAEPSNTHEMSEALIAVAENTSLREELRRRGTAHVKQFSWRRVAESTVALYRELAEPRLFAGDSRRSVS